MESFQKDIYRGYLIRADLNGAIRYVKQFPEKKELYEKYQSLFEKEQYLTYDVDPALNEILLIYQKYYRDVLYLNRPCEDAEKTMLGRLKALLMVEEPDITMEKLEETYVARVFTQKGYGFQGGQTGSYYGPYIWTKTELKTYAVELPEGIQEYSVRFLDGFISRSWMAYISFSEVGTGGWTDENGMINCVKSAYHVESESFQVSLLKHEAQHAMDRANYTGMTSAEMEYRAKLVELIYTKEQNLLHSFLLEADTSQENNGHAVASDRIAKGFMQETGCSRAQLEQMPIPQIQRTAAALFAQSSEALKPKRKENQTDK